MFDVNATQKQINIAVQKALARALKYFEINAAQKIAAETKIDKRIIRGRLKKVIKKKTLEGIMQVFVDRVPAVLANLKQNSKGVKFGNIMLKSAFIAKLTRLNKRPYRPMERMSITRYPLIQVKVPIEEEAKSIIDILAVDTERVFMGYIYEELKREVYGII